VKYVRYKARMIRAFIGLGLVVSLLVMLTGCWPFNTFPVAYFTASPLSGPAPLSVAFSAMLSEDPDGFIAKWEWDFGDGESGVGESISHTYDTPGTYDVTLRVTDDDSATATAQRTITVTAAEEPGGAGAGPTASFTATPLVGPAPLSVTFNASASAYAGHAITYYSWDFGDGVTGTGMTTTHTYAPLVTSTYNVVLRIIAADNTEGTTTKSITATVTPATPPTNAPTASFKASKSTGLAPLTVEFDPSASEAATGHDILSYNWLFGDDHELLKTTDDTVTHSYTTADSSHTYTCRLTVVDDEGRAGTASRGITVRNHQPVAGFRMKFAGGTYVADDLQTSSTTVTVYFDPTLGKSQPPAGDAEEWVDNPPAAFADNNFSYDPDGNNATYGIKQYSWTADDKDSWFDSNNDGDEVHGTFSLQTGDTSGTINVTLEVWDKQNGRGTLTRQIELGVE